MRKLRWPIWVISIMKEDIYEMKNAVKTIIVVLNLIFVVSNRNNMILTKSLIAKTEKQTYYGGR